MMETIKDILADLLHLDDSERDEIHYQTHLVNDLFMDDFNLIDFISALEDQFDVVFPDDFSESHLLIQDYILFLISNI